MTDHERLTDEQLRWLMRPDFFQKLAGWIAPMARELLELRVRIRLMEERIRTLKGLLGEP